MKGVPENVESTQDDSNQGGHKQSIQSRGVSESSSKPSSYSGSDSEVKLTPLERLTHDLSNDVKCTKEITLGKRIGFYRIRGELGSGNFSQVKLGIHSLTREKVAIKILDKTKLDQKTQRLLSREIANMDKLHHPNIIRLYEVVETLAKLHMVMEYACGGEIFTKISNEGKLTEAESKGLYAQVVAAVEHMHEQNIVHRDLKAENVFYASPTLVKVGDFGFSTVSRPDQTLCTFCGSPPYAAPELFKDESYFGTYVDVWALGIMLYFMVTGIMPFRAETVAKLKKCILDGSYTIPSYVSDSCQFLIRSTLKHIPHDRFTVAEIKRSEWLRDQSFPPPFEYHNLNPTPNNHSKEITKEELETRQVLKDLGITEEHLMNVNDLDSRSSITGTYRIVLHRIQKKNSGVIEGMMEQPRDLQTYSNKKSSKKSTPHSKLCTVL